MTPSITLAPLHIEQDRFVDAHGRQVLLRGVNLGGDSKVPYPHGGTQHPSDFSDHRTVSFVGRPFPMSEADSHFARLRTWGFNCLRLVTTWEAIEHAGPGRYDEDYLRYVRALCVKAGEHGFYVFIDMHQDVWSRMSGGDGAPAWTFEAVGLDHTAFDAADAALVMQHRYDYRDTEARQAGYPQMVWHRNYRLPANGIMWTLFWAGRRLAPQFQIAGKSAQDWLQDRFLDAMLALARQLLDLPHVIGFDVLNEPGLGWLGQPLSKVRKDHPLPGPAVTPLDALAIARGRSVDVAVLSKGQEVGRQRFNKMGRSIWRPDAQCPFETAGIYRLGDEAAEPLDEQAFERLHISDDVFSPFFATAAERLRALRSDWLLMAQMDPLGTFMGRPFPRQMPAQSASVSHWYDFTTLATKHFDAERAVDVLTGEVAVGPEALRDRYVRQMAALKLAAAAVQPAGMPTLIGEFGIPFDLDGGLAYRQWAAGDREHAFAPHTQALELMYEALDELLLSSTQWNYTAGNRNDLRIGDQWNQEDLSIYSVDQVVPGDPLSGGRAVAGFARPYASAVQGRLKLQRFRRAQGLLEIEIDADPRIQAPTEIVLPDAQFPAGCVVRSSGVPMRWSLDGSLLRLWAEASGAARIECSAVPAPVAS